jgi:hypothetical protein
MQNDEELIPDQPLAENIAPVKKEFVTHVIGSTQTPRDQQRAIIMAPDQSTSQPATDISYSHETEVSVIPSEQPKENTHPNDTFSDEDQTQEDQIQNASNVGSEDDTAPEVKNQQVLSDPGNQPASVKKSKPVRYAQLVVSLLMLGVIIIGAVLIIQSIRATPAPLPIVTGGGSTGGTTLQQPWCAAVEGLAANFPGTNLSGLATNDVWTASNQIKHWDGSAWQTSFIPPTTQDTFMGIAEIGSGNVWAVGEQVGSGLASHPLIVHLEGQSWRVLTSPDAFVGGKNSLLAVAGTSAGNVWAAGFAVPSQGPVQPLLEHWDGSKWSIISLTGLGSAQLTSLHAISSTDVWAVGFRSIAASNGTYTSQPLTEHWDSTGWSSVANPDLTGQGGGKLYSIAGTSSNDVWAVGSTNNSLLSEHWDGKNWSIVPTPNVSANSNNWLVSVATNPSGQVWAVGRLGSADAFQTYIVHWNGSQWVTESDPLVNSGQLNAITSIGKQFWIAGIPGASGSSAFVHVLCP